MVRFTMAPPDLRRGHRDDRVDEAGRLHHPEGLFEAAVAAGHRRVAEEQLVELVLERGAGMSPERAPALDLLVDLRHHLGQVEVACLVARFRLGLPARRARQSSSLARTAIVGSEATGTASPAGPTRSARR